MHHVPQLHRLDDCQRFSDHDLLVSRHGLIVEQLIVYFDSIQIMLDLDLTTGFEWDAGNATKSTDKHGVSRSEAEQVFLNEPLVIAEDVKHSQAKPRYHALGKTDAGRLLHITFTVRVSGTKIRVISARDMHRKERKIYAQA